jgi:hypothetical protein
MITCRIFEHMWQLINYFQHVGGGFCWLVVSAGDGVHCSWRCEPFVAVALLCGSPVYGCLSVSVCSWCGVCGVVFALWGVWCGVVSCYLYFCLLLAVSCLWRR